MHAKRDKLGTLFILPEEIKNVVSSTTADSSLDVTLKENMNRSYRVTHEFYNYSGTTVRLVGQDNLEIHLDNTVRPEGIESGIVIAKTLTTFHSKSKIDPRCKTNSPTDDFEQSIGIELQTLNKKTISKQRTTSKDSETVRVLYLIPVELFENADTIYDSKSDYVLSVDLSRNLYHPHASQGREFREVMDFNKGNSENESSIKYVLVDNTNLYSQLYINTGSNVICVNAISDESRDSGLYVYTSGTVESQAHKKMKSTVVKFDVTTILSEKLFAFHSYAEAKAAGNLDERYKELEKRLQAKSAQDERTFKNTETNSKREDRMREERSKKIADGLKLATAIAGFTTVLITTIAKTKSSK